MMNKIILLSKFFCFYSFDKLAVPDNTEWILKNKNNLLYFSSYIKKFKKDTKLTQLMPNSSDGTHFIFDKKAFEKSEKLIPKDTKITLETLSTQLDKYNSFKLK